MVHLLQVLAQRLARARVAYSMHAKHTQVIWYLREPVKFDHVSPSKPPAIEVSLNCLPNPVVQVTQLINDCTHCTGQTTLTLVPTFVTVILSTLCVAGCRGSAATSRTLRGVSCL